MERANFERSTALFRAGWLSRPHWWGWDSPSPSARPSFFPHLTPWLVCRQDEEEEERFNETLPLGMGQCWKLPYLSPSTLRSGLSGFPTRSGTARAPVGTIQLTSKLGARQGALFERPGRVGWGSACYTHGPPQCQTKAGACGLTPSRMPSRMPQTRIRHSQLHLRVSWRKPD